MKKILLAALALFSLGAQATSFTLTPAGNTGDAQVKAAGNRGLAPYSGTVCTNQFIRTLNPQIAATCAAIDLVNDTTGILPVAKGGTGTATPGLVGGTNVSISGTWPNQTISATAGGSGITVQDEGSSLTTGLALINFVGSGVTCTGTTSITCSVPGASISDAAADGTTKGQATFNSNDFNSAAGVISLDYTNGQTAASGVKGFLSAADWALFNGKQAAITFGTGVQAALANAIGSPGAPLVYGGVLNGTTLTTTGLNVMPGVIQTAANAMGALAIDVTKSLNTKSISADSTFTFSATATTDAPFTLAVTNTDTNPHTLTIPSSKSVGRQATITTAVIPASGVMYLTWRYNGSTYDLLGNDQCLSKYNATAAPATTDDVSKGYCAGSLWYDATNNNTYIMESNTASAAVWTQVNTGGGSGTVNSGTANQCAGYASTGTAVSGVTVSGDGTLNCNTGALAVTKTGGISFGALATVTPGSGVATAAAAPTNGTGGFTTTDGTKTLTNTGLDCEGTGNTCTVPVKVWLAAAGCNNATASSFWDLPTATPAVAACVTGTNTQKAVLQYADTSGGFSAQNTLLLPADWTGNIDARIIWRTSATSGNAKWSLSTICTDVAATATDDPAFNTASTVTTAAPGTANRIQTSSISAVTATGCAAGNLLHVKLFRDGNDASDTISANADVIGVELTLRRAM